MNEKPDDEAMIAALVEKFRQQLQATLPNSDLTMSEIEVVADVLGNGVQQDILEYVKHEAEVSGGARAQGAE